MRGTVSDTLSYSASGLGLGVGRDYDIAVSANFRSALEFSELIVEIAEALDVHEDLVDVVHIKSADIGVLYSIIKDVAIIYGNENETKNDLWRKCLEILNLERGPELLKQVTKREVQD